MTKVLFSVMAIFAGIELSHAQYNKPLHEYQPDSAFNNVYVKKIAENDDQSAYIIWVRQNVRPHYHAWHTEHIVVISGEGWMRLGSDSLQVKHGDHIYIPKGTVHSVYHVSGSEPLKVLSIQSPKFDGEDRIWADE